tara:strand:+ start:2044 stop:2313 length:270 start_codon:yes stop_codon:yes gene_type:complete
MPEYKDFTDGEKLDIYNKAINGEVATINRDTEKLDWETSDHFKQRTRAYVEHLEHILGHKKADKTTSIWTTEDLAPINAAIAAGKARIA